MGADEEMDLVANSPCTGDIMISPSSSSEMKKKKKKKKDKKKDKSSKSKKKRKYDDDDKSPKKAKKSKKRKKLSLEQEEEESSDNVVAPSKSQQPHQSKSITTKQQHFPFEYQHILAPMVGASELAFRLLCRKYGATLSYTPMMSASQFIQEAATVDHAKNGNIGNSNICEFQTIPQDRPLVCHFSANDPEHFARAAALVEPYCDAIDLK
jgi:flagellar biosynthesis GTPase FlhF